MVTEAEASANILAWSADSPGWQRDALRRLATHAGLEPSEIDDLVLICKGDNPAMPLEAGHLRYPDRDHGEVYLRHVHGVRHVNALAPDQRLDLHCVGLTIIYGDNGSGKSGYARILKMASRARMPGRADEIIPDIYDPAPGTPSATIDYAIGGQDRTSAWQLGRIADDALSAASRRLSALTASSAPRLRAAPMIRRLRRFEPARFRCQSLPASWRPSATNCGRTQSRLASGTQPCVPSGVIGRLCDATLSPPKSSTLRLLFGRVMR